jgi:hypothetical protein
MPETKDKSPDGEKKGGSIFSGWTSDPNPRIVR